MLSGSSFPRSGYLVPHWRSEANAYYDTERGALCFGYFVSEPDTPIPNTHVFTCLSQDVVAHELTHALLLGMNIEFGSAKRKDDMGALHEAFSDLVALFLHFWKSDVLRAQIAAIRGLRELRSRARKSRTGVVGLTNHVPPNRGAASTLCFGSIGLDSP